MRLLRVKIRSMIHRLMGGYTCCGYGKNGYKEGMPLESVGPMMSCPFSSMLRRFDSDDWVLSSSTRA